MSETNFEHYKDEIIEAFLKSSGCKFKEKYILHVEYCEDENIDCEKCSQKTKEWLDKEYNVEKVEIDWTKVPVDTPVLVWDGDNEATATKYARFFALYMPKRTYGFSTFDNGDKRDESKSTGWWKHCELACKDDIEKYKKV